MMTQKNTTQIIKISLIISLLLVLSLSIIYVTMLYNAEQDDNGIDNMYITDKKKSNTLNIKDNERLDCVNKCIDIAFDKCEKLYDSYNDKEAEKCFNENYTPCTEKCPVEDDK